MIMRTFYVSVLELALLEKLIVFGRSYTHELSKNLTISPAHVNRLCHALRKRQILNVSSQENRKFFELNYQCLLTRELLRFITVIKIKNSKYFRKLGEICPFGVFGSFSEGMQTKESDLDLWVFSDRSFEKKIRLIINDIEKEWEHIINIVYLDKNKLEIMKKNDPEFYYRLRSQSLTERGDIFE
ncbi:MAG TPA: hypothetical protein DD708_03730 [Deltaproteobacteria bacterium]|nr:hypothetical protein [Deltaproteobacteria bacterium]